MDEHAPSSPMLRLSLRVRIAFGLAVVYLMIAKPDAGESLLVLALASVLTIATNFIMRTAQSTRFRDTDEHGIDRQGIGDHHSACR